MRTRKLITIFVLFSMILGLYSCEFKLYRSAEIGDIEYSFHSNTARAVGLTKQGREKEVIYIPDTVKGKKVIGVGENSPVADYIAHFNSLKLKKIYFPWSANSLIITMITYSETNIFNVNNNYNMYSIRVANERTIISAWAYENYTYLADQCIPANISYMFNYADCPNEGYYSIDLITETGKLTPQPYEPPREGYTFGGWYKESECVNEWNFETDEIIISFDEEGNRIYEEIKLYAKWIEK